jgi:hypothetical protein
MAVFPEKSNMMSSLLLFLCLLYRRAAKNAMLETKQNLAKTEQISCLLTGKRV